MVADLRDSMNWTKENGHILEMVQAIPVESSVHSWKYTEHALGTFDALIKAVDDLAHDRDSLTSHDCVDAAIEGVPQSGTDVLNFAINRFRREYERAVNSQHSAPEELGM